MHRIIEAQNIPSFCFDRVGHNHSNLELLPSQFVSSSLALVFSFLSAYNFAFGCLYIVRLNRASQIFAFFKWVFVDLNWDFSIFEITVCRSILGLHIFGRICDEIVVLGSGRMELEWVVLGYAASAEAIMLLLLTMTGLDRLRKGLIVVAHNALKPMLCVVPFCMFLLMDTYWKCETRPTCEWPSCSPSEHLSHQKSIMKSQRNALLIATTLVLYWLLVCITNLVERIESLTEQVKKLKNSD
eukprot:Gb_10982 [translate_table: standard]